VRPAACSDSDDVSTARVDCSEVLPLRTAVFRPLLDGVRPYGVALDEAPGSAHFCLYNREGSVLGVASFLPESPPDRPATEGFRIFGFCIAPGWRGRGLGARFFAEAFQMHRRAVEGRFEAWGWTTDSKADFWRAFGFGRREAEKRCRGRRYVLLSGASTEITVTPP
jgi:GNAT superfamily N-acetyltransferase